jgi:hypothetical protein
VTGGGVTGDVVAVVVTGGTDTTRLAGLPDCVIAYTTAATTISAASPPSVAVRRFSGGIRIAGQGSQAPVRVGPTGVAAVNRD